MSSSSPFEIAQELGRRLRLSRLNANITQVELARRAGVTRNTVLSAESGKVHLETFVALLQALDLAQQLDLMLPEPPISPMQLLKLRGKQRKRASRQSDARDSDSPDW